MVTAPTRLTQDDRELQTELLDRQIQKNCNGMRSTPGMYGVKPQSARPDTKGQHIVGIDGIKSPLRRASPALDPFNTERRGLDSGSGNNLKKP